MVFNLPYSSSTQTEVDRIKQTLKDKDFKNSRSAGEHDVNQQYYADE